MFARLVQKELLHHLLDFRFIAVFLLCALLSALSVYVGGRNYARQLQEYNIVSESNRRTFQENSIDKGRLFDLVWSGYQWNRRPEVLSPMVYGLSGALGRQVRVRYQTPPLFESSAFETDPIHLLFEVLDLSFIVKIVLSLCVLLFTYDAVCGEKEAGTLRLYASFPISRSALALAKLSGSTLAVLVPFIFAFLLSAVVMALSPNIGLQTQDWARIAALMIVFALYLIVFTAFGLFISALTHRRLTAFLGLLALWAIWLFVIPNLALDLSRRLAPVQSVYDLQKQLNQLHWEARRQTQTDLKAYEARTWVENFDTLSEAEQEAIGKAYREARYKIETRYDTQYHTDLTDKRTRWQNQIRQQHRLAIFFSAISPLGAVTFPSLDLARTGFTQQERIENALNTHLTTLAQFIHGKRRQSFDVYRNADMSGFTWFTYQDRDTLADCLSRNLFHILNLILLAVLGFAAAYMAILRYDVR